MVWQYWFAASEDGKAYTRDCEKRAFASGAYFVCLHCHGAVFCWPITHNRQSTEARNMDSSTVSVAVGVAANASVAATKFIAAAATGSGAMLAEAIHSLVDTVNSSLILLGIRLSRRPPDGEASRLP